MTDKFLQIRNSLVIILDIFTQRSGEMKLSAMNNTNFDNDVLSNIYCYDKGNWKENYCDCDLGFFGTHCLIPGLEYWGNGWTTLQVFFSIVYAFISIFTWIYFKRSISEVIFI